MERDKLIEEYKVTLESLVEKTKFCYSEEFYKLDDSEKQKYQRDKMATEGHLGTLCNLLWGDKVQFSGGLSDIFALSIISSIFNGGGFGTMTSSPSFDYLSKEIEKSEKAIKAITCKDDSD